MNAFGEFLYLLRKEKNMTQAQLAEALGVTNKAVSKWETGEAMPDTALLLPIARIFGVTVDELLDGKRKTVNGSEEEGGGQEYEKEDFADPVRQHLFTRGKEDRGNKTLSEKICGAVCAAVFLLGAAAYLLIGVLTNAWTPYWVITPVCALCCGLIGIIFDMCNRNKREEKIERGENPYTGAICGLVMLSCIIAYLLVGALTGLWHPYWVIVVGGALADGIIGAIGGIFVHKQRKNKEK